MSPLACPFCGAALRPTRAGFQHPTRSDPLWRDPQVTRCLLSGFHIGAALLGRWNLRSDPKPEPEPPAELTVNSLLKGLL